MINLNQEVGLGSYLTQEEQELLAADRKMIIARTLALQVRLLEQYGSTESQIQDGVANMRAKFGDLPTESIQRIQESLGSHASVLIELQMSQPAITVSNESVPSLTVVGQTELAAENVPPELEAVIDMPVQQPIYAVVLNNEVTETEELLEIPEIDYDDKRPKNLPIPVNNLLNGVFTFEQRNALMALDVEQRVALLKAFHETMETKSRRPKLASLHTNRLDKLLEGMDIKELAKLEGQTPGAITSAFRNQVHTVLRDNRTDFMRKYISHLGTTDIPFVMEEQLNDEKLREPLVKTAKQEIPRPENMHALINNLLSRFLSYEQREAVAAFSPDQVSELVALFETIYEDNAVRLEEKDRHIMRMRSLMNGMEPRDIAIAEGIQSIIIVQSFSKLLPKIFTPYKDRIIEGLASIQSEETHSDTAEDDNQLSVESNQSYYYNSETVAEIAIKPLDTAIITEKLEEKIESHVELMMNVYKTDDPRILKGIEELFSLDKGSIHISEDSIEAAMQLGQLVRVKGINLSLEIANPHGRSVVERLLHGIPQGDIQEWSTLSEIIQNTPDSMRQAKRSAALKALEKLSSKLESSATVRVDAREQQITSLRSELHKYIELPPELTNQIIDRALGDDDEFSSELGRGLVQFHRVAAGVGLDEVEIDIVRKFTTPRIGQPPMGVRQIHAALVKFEAKYRDEGYVSSMLLRSFTKIVTQRSDG